MEYLLQTHPSRRSRVIPCGQHALHCLYLQRGLLAILPSKKSLLLSAISRWSVFDQPSRTFEPNKTNCREFIPKSSLNMYNKYRLCGENYKNCQQVLTTIIPQINSPISLPITTLVDLLW